MTDSIEARLAAAKSIQGLLLDADWTLAELTGALSHDGLAPTLAADLALAAAVRELEDITEMSYDPSLRRGQWDVRINDHVGVGDTLTAAIEAAKEASE